MYASILELHSQHESNQALIQLLICSSNVRFLLGAQKHRNDLINFRSFRFCEPESCFGFHNAETDEAGEKVLMNKVNEKLDPPIQ
jgi:hypothetical protein